MFVIPTGFPRVPVRHHDSILWVTGSVLLSRATAFKQCPRLFSCSSCSLCTAQEQWHTHKTTRNSTPGRIVCEKIDNRPIRARYPYPSLGLSVKLTFGVALASSEVLKYSAFSTPAQPA